MGYPGVRLDSVSMDFTIIIKATDVHKTYDGGKIKVHALRGVNLSIQKGEMVTIMGPSGCGKTTLLNCLSGLDEVTTGNVEIEGAALTDMSENDKTDYEKPGVARKKALDALSEVGLKGWENHRPAELSGGQRQRVTIARSLVNEPLIVFGDEPTGDLDRETTQDILNIICRLNKENNQTFVLVTHDPKVAERTHRILEMENGVIIRESQPSRG